MRAVQGCSLLAILLLAQPFAACSSTEAIAETGRAWKYSEFDEVRGDGDWRIRFPDDVAVFAEGHLSGEHRVGEWRYLFHDGTPLARGAFDSQGRMQGAWIFWQPDGAICRQRHGIVCDGLSLGEFISDHDHLQLNRFPEASWSMLSQIFPSHTGSAHGSGYYADGVWDHKLTDDELRRLDPAHALGQSMVGDN